MISVVLLEHAINVSRDADEVMSEGTVNRSIYMHQRQERSDVQQ